MTSAITSKGNPKIGDIVVTPATSSSHFQQIIHVSLPFWQNNDDILEIQSELHQAYLKVFEKIEEIKAESVVFTDLTVPPMQIPISLHAECLVGAATLYVEDNYGKTCIKTIYFTHSDKEKIKRYTYQLQSKLVGMSDSSVKDRIRKSISDIRAYNSLGTNKLNDDTTGRSFPSSVQGRLIEPENSPAHPSKTALQRIAEMDFDKEDQECDQGNSKKQIPPGFLKLQASENAPTEQQNYEEILARCKEDTPDNN